MAVHGRPLPTRLGSRFASWSNIMIPVTAVSENTKGSRCDLRRYLLSIVTFEFV
jgi:hypothetical protein